MTNSSLPLIDRFLNYLTDERHFSPYTARCYGADLRQYVEFLSDDLNIRIDQAAETNAVEQVRSGSASSASGTLTGHICEANADAIRVYLNHLADQNYSPATMARKIATLRSFYKWALQALVRGCEPDDHDPHSRVRPSACPRRSRSSRSSSSSRPPTTTMCSALVTVRCSRRSTPPVSACPNSSSSACTTSTRIRKPSASAARARRNASSRWARTPSPLFGTM